MLPASIDQGGYIVPIDYVEPPAFQRKSLVSEVRDRRNEIELPIKLGFDSVLIGGEIVR